MAVSVSLGFGDSTPPISAAIEKAEAFEDSCGLGCEGGRGLGVLAGSAGEGVPVDIVAKGRSAAF